MRAKKGKRWGISSMALSSLNTMKIRLTRRFSLAVLRNDLEESFLWERFRIYPHKS